VALEKKIMQNQKLEEERNIFVHYSFILYTDDLPFKQRILDFSSEPTFKL